MAYEWTPGLEMHKHRASTCAMARGTEEPVPRIECGARQGTHYGTTRGPPIGLRVAGRLDPRAALFERLLRHREDLDLAWLEPDTLVFGEVKVQRTFARQLDLDQF